MRVTPSSLNAANAPGIGAVIGACDPASRTPWFNAAALIDHQDFTRHICEALVADIGDEDALGDLESPIAKMQPGHEMYSHAGLQLGAIAAPEAQRVLAPVGGIGKANRVAGTALLL